MMLIACILICFVLGYGVCSELNGTRVIHRESEEHGVYHCIPRICPKNYHAILCMVTDPANPGKDDCIPCDENTFNPTETNTSAIPYHIQFPMDVVCRKPDCNCGPEGFLVNKHQCDVTGAQKICVCNANKGYCGDDYKNCVKWNGKESDIREGYGLTPKCTIEKCGEGNSKAYPGYGACAPSTNITTTGTTQRTAPSTSGPSGTDLNKSTVVTNSTEVITNSTEATNTTTPIISQDKDGGLVLKIAIPLSLVAVIILSVWMGIKFCCRNKFDPENGKRDASDDKSSEATSMV